MIWLWIAAALVSAGLAALIVQRAARKAMAVRAESPALAVYRRQMAELDALADLGVLAESERRSVRAETGRRLLAAADRTEAPLVVGRPTPILMAAAAAPLVAVIVFMAMGPADYPDEPFAQRLAGWRAMDPSMLTPPQMAAILGDDAAKHPDDPVPLQHLAVAELASGHAAEAAQALDRALALDPRDAAVWEMRGVISTVEAGGDVKPDAARDFRRALALDPALTNARYYLARARIAGGDVAGGLADWRSLMASLPASDERRAALAEEIAAVAKTGKLESAMAPAAPQVGPPQIQAMVNSLAARLKAQPDDPDGWVRLVRAYSVLGETQRRDAALAAARARYAGRADVLSALAKAARPAS